jgi:hypothetical protein
MKVTAKIIILVLAISLAIGGVMIYAKTKVAPPLATKPIDQFSKCLADGMTLFNNAATSQQEDSLFAVLTEKMRFYVSEGKLTKDNGNAEMNKLCSRYVPLFLNRSMEKFSRQVWHDTDHSYMLTVVAKLRSLRNFDNSQVLEQQSLDSLALIERIISDYKQARAISRHTSFTGTSSAQKTINRAQQLAKDPYLSNCTDLVTSLNSVRAAIATSHYNQVCAIVEKLSQYEQFSQSYYDNTLVPQVDAVVTEYDNKATELYGTKQNVNELWNRARAYYNDASGYYNQNQN